MKRLAAISFLALCASACGGSGPSTYTRAASAACFAEAGVHVRAVPSASDFVANSATGGAFRVKLARNAVTVSFGDTAVDADNIEQAYRRFKTKNVGIDDILRRDKNAIMLWRLHPEDSDAATITGCLKG